MRIYNEQLRAWIIDDDGDGVLDTIKPSENSDPLSFFGAESSNQSGTNQLDLSVLDQQIVKQFFSQACGPLLDVRICPFLDYIYFVAVADHLDSVDQRKEQSDYLYRAFLAARQAHLPECLLIEGVRNFENIERRDPEFALTVAVHLYLAEHEDELALQNTGTRRQREQRINDQLFKETDRMHDLIANDSNGLVDWPYVPQGENLLVSMTYGLSVGPFISRYTGRVDGPYVLSEEILPELEQYALFVQRSRAKPEIKAFALEQVGRTLSEYVHDQIEVARDMKERGHLPPQTAFWRDLTAQLFRLPAPLLQSVVGTYSQTYDEGLIMSLYCGEYAML